MGKGINLGLYKIKFYIFLILFVYYIIRLKMSEQTPPSISRF